MKNAVGAGAGYFMLVFAAGFLLGTLRTLLLLKFLGELTAVAIELPIILSISWLACAWLIRRYSLPAQLTQRAVMGATALLLLLLAEAALSLTLAQRSITEHLMLYNSRPVQLGLAGQLLFALFPWIQSITNQGSIDPTPRKM
jgi:hypothetical protein